MTRTFIFKRVFCTVMAAAFAFSNAGCKDTNKKENSSDQKNLSSPDQAENIFISEKINIPDDMEYVENMMYASDKIYLSGYKTIEDSKNLTVMLDVGNRTVSELNLNDEIRYVISAYMSDERIDICYNTEQSDQYLAVFDRSTGKEISKTVVNNDSFFNSL